MEEISFNLLENPWIPCKMKPNKYVMMSIKETLYNAHEILEISSDNPLIVISLYRFLLAILHRNFGPKNKDEWINIYKAGKWDKNTLEQYFKKWHHKFELFNEPEHRFYQFEMPEITKPTPITKLNHALSSGNNAALFDHNWDSNIDPIKIEKVVQIQIAYQNYAVGGGRSTPFNYSHAPLISGLIILLKGNDLFETLMLNFIRYDGEHPFKILGGNKDIPFWERENKTLYQDKKGRNPLGYLDYLTWQSRRIWLKPYLENGDLKVKELYLAQGEKVKEDWNSDPQMMYKLDKKNKLNSIKLYLDRQVWREIEALLRLNMPEKFAVPKAIDWVADLDLITLSKRINIEIYGLCNDPSKAAKLISWHRSSIPLSLEFLENQDMVNDVKDFIDKAENIQKILNKTIYIYAKNYLFPNVDTIGTNQKNNINDLIKNYQIEIKFWNQVENHFYKVIEELAKEPKNFKKHQEIVANQVKNVIKIAQQLLDNIKDNIKNDPRALKSFIQNVGYFHKNVYKIKSSN